MPDNQENPNAESDPHHRDRQPRRHAMGSRRGRRAGRGPSPHPTHRSRSQLTRHVPPIRPLPALPTGGDWERGRRNRRRQWPRRHGWSNPAIVWPTAAVRPARTRRVAWPRPASLVPDSGWRLGRDRGGRHAQGDDFAIPDPPDLPSQGGRYGAIPCRRRRSRTDRLPVAQGARRDGYRDGGVG